MKKLGLWIGLIVGLAIGIEGVSWGSLYLFKKMKTIRYSPIREDSLSQRHLNALQGILAGQWKYLGLDADLGWTVKPSVTGTRYHSNSQGIRGDVDYAFVPAPDTIRITTFGDFVYAL